MVFIFWQLKLPPQKLDRLVNLNIELGIALGSTL